MQNTIFFLSHITESLNRKIYLRKLFINEYHIMIHSKKKKKNQGTLSSLIIIELRWINFLY